MGVKNPKFPTTTWDGLSENPYRHSRLDDAGPDFRDWDQLVAEMISTQVIVAGLNEAGGASLAVTTTPISGGTNGLILKLSNGFLAQVQLAAAIPDTTSATLPNLEIEVNKLKALLRTAKLLTP